MVSRMGATGTPKPGARRFCLCATGEIGYYIACDLDEGRLRFWEETRSRGYSSLLLSENREERRAAFEVIRRHAESEYCVGVELTERQTADMESLLTPDCIESMRGITNDSMAQRSQYFCYRDGWSLSFYAEGDDGLPPLSLNGITWCSFMDDELPFELLESYVGSEILNNRCEAFPYDVSHKAIPEKTRQIATKALEVGMEAIDEVLWYGTRRLLVELDNTEIGRHLSYELSDDSFTIRYGNEISRGCKLYQRPACEKVFGRRHVFQE